MMYYPKVLLLSPLKVHLLYEFFVTKYYLEITEFT